jgi:hypothetical protein
VTRRALALLAGFAALLAAVGLVLRQPALGPTADLPPAGAQPVRLMADVMLLSKNLSPRSAGDLKNLDRCAQAIGGIFKLAGGKVRVQSYTFAEMDPSNKLVQRGPYKNVIARFGPETGRPVVVGAHYDAYGPFPGADDNASGVAALLELARLLGKTPPPGPVVLAAYSLEEPPYFETEMMGSVVHARELKDVKAMLSLETLGRFTDEAGSQGFPTPLMRLYYPSKGNFVSIVGRFQDRALCRLIKREMRRASALPAYSVNAPAWIPGVDYSDHASFWARGFPAVMLTDTAFYRNHDYHTERDVSEKLDYARLAQVVEGIYRAVLKLAIMP